MTRKSVAFAIGFVLLPLSAQAQSWPVPPSLYSSSSSAPHISNPYNPPPVGGIFNSWAPQPYGFQPQMPTSRPCVPAAGDRC